MAAPFAFRSFPAPFPVDLPESDMKILRIGLFLALPLLLAACGHGRPPAARTGAYGADVRGGAAASNAGYDAPPFAIQPYEPFSRDDAVALALDEWRLFGNIVHDEAPDTRPPPESPAEKPERQPGLWQRIGEYWWIGQDPGTIESRWTGKHDGNGRVFAFTDDGRYAWSAAFISYIMREAGAGDRFPYSASHADYINAAAAGSSTVLKAYAPSAYAPQLGDLICTGRGSSAGTITFANLPTSHSFPAHCGIVVQREPGQIGIIGGNVGDAVALTHVPVTADGMLANPDGSIVDTRYPWLTVLKVIYDVGSEPASDQ